MANNKISKKAKILNFLSFGHLKRKAKKQMLDNSEKKENFDFSFPISEFLSALGGKENMTSYQLVSTNSLKICVKDIATVNLDKIKVLSDAIGTSKTNNDFLIISKKSQDIFKLLNSNEEN